MYFKSFNFIICNLFDLSQAPAPRRITLTTGSPPAPPWTLPPASGQTRLTTYTWETPATIVFAWWTALPP